MNKLKKIKTKQVIKNIKALDKKADVSRRMKNAYIRTKSHTEQPEYNFNGNYVNNAENSVLNSTGTIVRKMGHSLGRYSKRTIGIMKRLIKRKKSISQAGVIKTTNQCSSFQPGSEAVAHTPYTFRKAGGSLKQSAETGRKTVKQAAKRTIKTSQKFVKTADRTAKGTIKTTKAAARTAAKTTVKSAQATQRAVQAARMTARAAAASLKVTAKVIVVTVKAAVAVVKSVATLIAAGGWIAVVVILVICLAGFLLSSVYGVFFSNESSGRDAPNMTEVIGQLNEDFSTEIQQIQNNNPHDTLEMSGNGNSIVNNWPDILAVYAVKVSVNPENGMEVVTLNAAKVSILQGIFRDMNLIEYQLETIEHYDRK